MYYYIFCNPENFFQHMKFRVTALLCHNQAEFVIIFFLLLFFLVREIHELKTHQKIKLGKCKVVDDLIKQ